MLHGQRREVDEPFEVDGFEILYPGQVAGESEIPQHLIWNCRCTLAAWVKGFEPDTVTQSPKMGDMSFEEWQQAKPMTKEEQAEWIKAGKPDATEWQRSAERKKIVNEKSDREQYERYRKILKENAPKSFDSFQELKYNDSDAWEYTKRLARYLEKYPTSDKRYFDAQEKLKELGIKRGVLLPPVQKNAAILPSGGKDPYHIMHRMLERHITDDELRSYIKDAKAMFVQWGGKRQYFVGDEGMCVIVNENGEWIFKTAWKKNDYNEEADKIMEVLKDVGL